MSSQPSTFIWYELMTSDPDAAARFYGTVVGWSSKTTPTPGMDYRVWLAQETPIGGLMGIPPDAVQQDMRPMWLGYVHVADVDASIGKIKAAGGTSCIPATDIPQVGRIAMVTDPQGAAFYLMTSLGSQPSESYSPTKVGHGGWHELHTTDWKAAITFYESQMGFQKSDTFDMGPMGTYQLFNTGGDPLGGMMNNPHFPKPMWLFYFNVDDIQTAKSRVEAGGGTVLQGPHQVPGGGWMIQGADPQGAMFALFSPPTAA